jgi:hypothetical protein
MLLQVRVRVRARVRVRGKVRVRVIEAKFRVTNAIRVSVSD